MKNEEIKTWADALKELNESYMDIVQTIKETTKEVKATKQLWRKGNNSKSDKTWFSTNCLSRTN